MRFTVQYQGRALPLPPPARPPQGWAGASPAIQARRISPAAMMSFAGPTQDAIVSITPQGWVAEASRVVPLRSIPQSEMGGDGGLPVVISAAAPNGWDAVAGAAPRRFPGALQNSDLSQYVVSITPQGWPAVAPDRVRVAPFPVSAQQDKDPPVQQVPTMFVPGAWLTYSDGPPRWPFPEALQQAAAGLPHGDLVSTPQGWTSTIPAQTVKPRPSLFFDLPVQQVPTAFVAAAWGAIWDGPPRKPFPPGLQRADQPVLAAYQTAVVTYPEGWQAVFPQLGKIAKPGGSAELALPVFPQARGWDVIADLPLPRERALPLAGDAFTVPAAFSGRAWVLASVAPPRPVEPDRSFIDLPLAAPTRPVLVAANYPDVTIRFRLVLQIQPDMRQAPAAAASGPVAISDGLPPRRMRTPAGEAATAPQGPFRGTPIGVTAWGYVDYHFRPIRPAPNLDQSRVLIKSGFRIASQPTLLGVSTGPTMLGVDAVPTILAVDAQATLLGVSTGPTLLGTSTGPSILGIV